MTAEVLPFPFHRVRSAPSPPHPAAILFLPLAFMWWVPLIWLEYWRKALR